MACGLASYSLLTCTNLLECSSRVRNAIIDLKGPDQRERDRFDEPCLIYMRKMKTVNARCEKSNTHHLKRKFSSLLRQLKAVRLSCGEGENIHGKQNLIKR